MKKHLLILTVLLVALCLTACRTQQTPSNQESTPTTDSQTNRVPDESTPSTEQTPSAPASIGLAYAPHSGKNTCTIVGIGVCTDTDVTIPEAIDGLTVVAIERLAFADCSQITGIHIPKTVERIGVEAFYGCTSLSEITIPSATTAIGANAFSGCAALTSAVFETNKGWHVAGDALDLTDSANAAILLRTQGDLDWSYIEPSTETDAETTADTTNEETAAETTSPETGDGETTAASASPEEIEA